VSSAPPPERPAGLAPELPAGLTNGLLTGLLDDAAVFPPGNASIPDAVATYRELMRSPYASAIGPLLMRAADTAAFVAEVRSGDDLRVGLVASPTGGLVELAHARDLLLDLDAAATLTQLEIALPADHPPAASAAALIGGLAFSAQAYIEVPRVEGWEGALDVLAADGAERAKFRTGGMTAEAHPSEVELASFMHACISRGLAFKLTAGLHHAVRHTTAEGFEQHGVLNVLAAVGLAQGGASVGDLAVVLGSREAPPLLDMVSGADHKAIRRSFVSFGCCGVTEPLDELAALGLTLEEDA
jgi:hypothetical protein